ARECRRAAAFLSPSWRRFPHRIGKHARLRPAVTEAAGGRGRALDAFALARLFEGMRADTDAAREDEDAAAQLGGEPELQQNDRRDAVDVHRQRLRLAA